MTTSTITDVRRIGGRLGAEVLGLDLARPLHAGTVEALEDLLHAHKVLAFRGQDLDDDAHQAFVAHFGSLTIAHPTLAGVDGAPKVLPVRGEGIRANRWHTDVTFVVAPPKLSSLRAVVVPPYGGDTVIADSEHAYLDLPEPLRALADHLWAVHTNAYDYVKAKQDGTSGEGLDDHRRAQRDRFVSRTWETAHPVVRVHPGTGRPGLFIGGFAGRLLGLSTTESRDILRLLQAYVERPENTLRWHWSPGDVIVFDNRVTQHYAPDDYADLPRELRRVTVAGDVPVSLDGQRSYVVSGDRAEHYTPAAS
jgi:alpha-ketoglutarate-dependent taurine dioxygenase